jgi:GalNAc-alpha-(1->4)-GalNAc-alpha-(1->3)-diNAcBac-PP-undecaprenol alpha-1,4-N-acetyl-D-galactosaminyltransferase
LRSRRILWVISSLCAGGAERVITELANSFADRGHSIAVLTLSEPRADHYQLDTRVERIALNVIWDSVSLWQSLASNWRRIHMIREAILRYQPDAVVSFIEQTNVRVLAALFGTGIPVVVSVRIDPRRHWEGRAWDRARRLLYPFAARVVVQTDGVVEWARGFVPHERVAVIPNFIRSLPCPSTQSRSCNALLAVGRLDYQKGFDVLIRAFAASGLSAQGVTLTILGEGPMRTVLSHLAASLGVGDAVLLPGVVKEPEYWMARATVFVLPSRYEGFPNALLEAMAMGCAVIAADCDSGPREIVRHGTDGILVPPENVEALADAMINLMGNDGLREQLGEAAVDVRNRFAHEQILEHWQKLVEGVIDVRRK